MKLRRILVHGHRGARGIYPENTLPAFEYAICCGADALEMDVAVTRDDVLVISHDPYLNPELCSGPNSNAPIRSLTSDEVSACAPIPSLDRVLELGRDNQVRFDIEIKSDPDHPEYTPAPEELARMTLAAIRCHRLEARAVVQSFDFRTLRAMKRLAPEIRLAALYEGPPRDFAEIAREAQADIVSPEFSMVTRERVEAAHAAGFEVVTWTPNEPREWDQLIGDGVDGIITDDPAALVIRLKPHHPAQVAQDSKDKPFIFR